jgi:hypothetical protein
MTIGKRIAIAVGAAVLTVGVVVALWATLPNTRLEWMIIVVGGPLSWLIWQVMPQGFIQELAVRGGPDAGTLAFTLGIPLTWFVLAFVGWFVAIGRMRSNSTLHRTRA